MTDWSATLTGIALVAAIVSPVITTLLNNRFQLKLKEREIMAHRRLNTIEGYIKSVSDCAYTAGVTENFAEYRALIFLYAPPEIHNKLRELNKSVEDTSFSGETSALLYDIAEALRAENKI